MGWGGGEGSSACLPRAIPAASPGGMVKAGASASSWAFSAAACASTAWLGLGLGLGLGLDG